MSLNDVPSNAVTQMINGPPGTIVAGFANGEVGLWKLSNGARLILGHILGAVQHLALSEHRLYVVTDLGQFLVWDLDVFYGDRCRLMREVWKKVPVVWGDNRPEVARVPQEHPCAGTLE